MDIYIYVHDTMMDFKAEKCGVEQLNDKMVDFDDTMVEFNGSQAGSCIFFPIFKCPMIQWVAGFGGSLVVDPPGVRKSSKGTNQRCHRSWPQQVSAGPVPPGSAKWYTKGGGGGIYRHTAAYRIGKDSRGRHPKVVEHQIAKYSHSPDEEDPPFFSQLQMPPLQFAGSMELDGHPH